jgi:hypothetical protein
MVLFSWWTWRESNPRPNKKFIRFLHAYFRFNFRVTARPKPPTVTLSSLFSLTIRGDDKLSLILLAPLYQTASRSGHLRDVLFQHLVPKLS